MLSFLEIKNVAIIDKISIEFYNGLNVITGETGAGKSIIINSINAILGERISKDIIRCGQDMAQITAIFYTKSSQVNIILDELGIEHEDDGSLVISREIYTCGKNICRVNGKIVPMSALKSLGEYIINIHGQNDNKLLFVSKKHIDLLDLFIGEKILELKNTYQEKLVLLRKEQANLINIAGNIDKREREIDILKYQINEISEANLVEGEDVELEKKRALVFNTEKIKNILGNSYELLSSDNGIRDKINMISNDMDKISSLDYKYSKMSEDLSNVLYQLDDIMYEIRDNLDNLFFNEELRETIDSRIDLISRLKKKYGNSIPKILEYLSDCEKELEKILNSEKYIKKSEQIIQDLNNTLFDLSKQMNELRVSHSKLLQDKITNELKDLEMKDSTFSINIDFDTLKDSNGIYSFKNNGLNKVDFFISTNKGQKEKQLSKIASGGEMSRVMLAIKSIISDKDNLESLIFDEIDTGISGIAAQKVGLKLSWLSKSHQLICITHLPQIAVMADNHYMIEKSTKNNLTKTTVKRLQCNEAVQEIARIIGGATISDITLQNAREMLENAKGIPQ